MTKFLITPIYKELSKAWDKHRLFVLYGGSSSSKTITALQKLVIYAYKNKNRVITLSAESLPVMKKTIINDFKTIVMGPLFDVKRWNTTDATYTFETGSRFQFVPADDEVRFHAMRQDILYLDEAFYIKKAIYDQASIRTREKIIATFNPRAVFWLKDLMDEPETFVHHSTYRDNPFVEQTIKDELDKRAKTDVNFHRVYNLGLWGSLEGLIFQEGVHWDTTDEWPADFKKERLGLDFGYSVDPAAIIHIRYHNGEIYLREVMYRREMLNSDIAPYLEIPTIADSAEPKSIAELVRLGKDVKPSVKGPDSINSGIQLLKQFKMNVTSDSLNLIKEFRSYTWQENRQGEVLTKPIDKFNHCIDAVRYGVNDMFVERPFWVI